MITVIMTIYDRSQFYKEALDSLANQNDQNFELIIYSNIPVVYDLSKFKDVTIDENAPVELNLKYADGIRKAKYDKIAFLDDDDVFTRDKIKFLNERSFSYLHNNYYHLTNGEHNYGRGFNMSCISINKKFYPKLADEYDENGFTGKSPDSFLFWYTLENNIPYRIIKDKLTGYRFRDYETIQKNMVDVIKTQILVDNEMKEYFKTQQVLNIINEKTISEKIMLRSYGIDEYVSLYDVAFMLRHSDRKIQKLISYILTLKYINNIGLRIINIKRNKNKTVK